VLRQDPVGHGGGHVDNPQTRAAQPAELAPAYVLLASQESSFVTGHIYDVQGGKGAA